MQKRGPVAGAHLVATLSGRLFAGTWEEILLQMKDADHEWEHASVREFMRDLARRGRTETGVIIPVTDAEARALLLSLDPLAALAFCDRPTLDELRALTETSSEALAKLWRSIDSSDSPPSLPEPPDPPVLPDQFLVLVDCSSEQEQASLLERLQADGFTCRALIS